MAKKRRTRRTKKRESRRYLILGSLIAGLLVIIAALGFYLYELGFEKGKQEVATRAPAHKPVQPPKPPKPSPPKPSEIIDLKEASGKTPKNEENLTKPAPLAGVTKTPKSKRAKLIIIIDDVAYGYQVRALKRLGIPINLSFFPPNSRHPNTPRYARTCKHYMIHLPMEALHYPHPEPRTLKVDSSSWEMERIIASVRKNFPRARYINNHTGSKFTADYQALKRLMPILDKYHFRLVDSRTTPKTQIPRIMQELHRPYIARNIFLDNKQDVAYIKRQIQKAVALARKKGLAIAIGHPHPATIKALRESKEILKKVDLIYIDQL